MIIASFMNLTGCEDFFMAKVHCLWSLSFEAECLHFRDPHACALSRIALELFKKIFS